MTDLAEDTTDDADLDNTYGSVQDTTDNDAAEDDDQHGDDDANGNGSGKNGDAALNDWIAEVRAQHSPMTLEALVEIESMVDVIEIAPSTTSVQDAGLEALWFRLDDEYVTTAIVPVPPMTAKHARKVAVDLAHVGADISQKPIIVVSALELTATRAASVAESIERLEDTNTIVVTDAPSRSTAAIPLVRRAPRTVLLVELRRSLVEATGRNIEIIGPDRVAGVVCVEPPSTRRFGRRSR